MVALTKQKLLSFKWHNNLKLVLHSVVYFLDLADNFSVLQMTHFK